MEGDLITVKDKTQTSVFQSTPSAWRETNNLFRRRCDVFISIHSLRMEGDTILSYSDWIQSVFQSTPSAWRETVAAVPTHWNKLFQSTPSAWRETNGFPYSLITCAFQSTPSAWRETEHLLRRNRQLLISIHSLRMEGDRRQKQQRADTGRFQSTPSAWRETKSLA